MSHFVIILVGGDGSRKIFGWIIPPALLIVPMILISLSYNTNLNIRVSKKLLSFTIQCYLWW